MRKFFLAMCVCLTMVMVASIASAEELWDFHLRGHTEGLALGAIPPPGFYIINEDFFAPGFRTYGDNGHTVGEGNPRAKLFAFVELPTFLWVPGCHFLGADYAAFIEEPLDYTNLRIQQPGFPTSFLGGSQWGLYNTVIAPALLSWTIPCDFHAMLGFEVGLNDGTTSPGDRVISHFPNGVKFAEPFHSDGGIYAESSVNTYVFAPLYAISWLHGPWNVTVFGEYDISTKDTDTNYQSADEFSFDYTVAYTCGKWTLGLGAASENQTGNDKFASFDPFSGTWTYRSQPGTKVSNYSMGPLLGYNFGPCSVTFIYNWPLYTKNDVGGEWFEFRLLVPLGNLGCSLGK